MSTPQATLTGLPSDVLNIILAKSDFVSIQRLRKVCRNLRNYIDEAPPRLSFGKISIKACAESIVIILETDGIFREVEYLNYGAQCLQKRDLIKKSVPYNESFLDISKQDLDLILKTVKHLEELIVWIDKGRNRKIKKDKPILDRILYILKTNFGSQIRPLKVKKLTMKICSQNHIMSVLPFLEPGTLEQISIFDIRRTNNIGEHTIKKLYIRGIVECEQWKMAKEVEMDQFLVTVPIRHFLNFETGNISVESICTRDLVWMKDAFLQSLRFKSFTIKYEDFKHPRLMIEEFGEPMKNGGSGFSYWVFGSNIHEDPLVLIWSPRDLKIQFVCFNGL